MSDFATHWSKLGKLHQATKQAKAFRPLLQRLCKESLYFLAKGVLNYAQPNYPIGVSPTFHGPICRSLDQVQMPQAGSVHGTRRLDLWPRGHLKTHLLTIAKSLQYYLIDPNVRVLIVCSNQDNAMKNMRAIKAHFERNLLLHWIFPDCVPNPSADTWTDSQLICPRTRNLAETTFKGIGVGHRITGWHFDVLVKDDVIDEKTDKSPEQMEKIIEWHTLSRNLLEAPNKGVDQVVGTRWLVGDLYGHIIANQPEYEVCHIQALYKDPQDEWRSAWPEQFPVPALLALREQDPYQFATQQMNDPKDAAIVDFKPDWLRHYRFSDDALNILAEVG